MNPVKTKFAELRYGEVRRIPLPRTPVNNGGGRLWSPCFLPADPYRRPSPWASLQESPEDARQLIEGHGPGYLAEVDRVQVAAPGHPLPQDAPHLEVAPVGVYAQQVHSPQYEGEDGGSEFRASGVATDGDPAVLLRGPRQPAEHLSPDGVHRPCPPRAFEGPAAHLEFLPGEDLARTEALQAPTLLGLAGYTPSPRSPCLL